MTFRAVTFDPGGVLLPLPESVLNRKWKARFGLPEGDLAEAFFCNSVAQRALIEQATSEEMRAEARWRLPQTPEEWEEFQADRRKNQAWDTELLAFIRELRSRYETGVICNGTPGVWEWARAYVNSDTFDVILFSAEEGVAKPDLEIYRRALSRLGVMAEETIFVDDWLPNVEAARTLGIHAVHHTGSLKVQEAINRLLCPQPPG